MPASVSAGEESYASRHVNGTGPFILKDFEPNGRIVMVRNPDWRGFRAVPTQHRPDKDVLFAKHDNWETDFYLLGWAPHDPQPMEH